MMYAVGVCVTPRHVSENCEVLPSEVEIAILVKLQGTMTEEPVAGLVPGAFASVNLLILKEIT